MFLHDNTLNQYSLKSESIIYQVDITLKFINLIILKNIIWNKFKYQKLIFTKYFLTHLVFFICLIKT